MNFTKLREQAEKFLKEVESVLSNITEIEQKDELQTQFDHKLRARESKLEEIQNKVKVDNERNIERESYLKKTRLELEKREQGFIIRVNELDRKEKSLEEKRKKLIEIGERNESRLKEFEGLQEKEQELIRLESLIKKEKLVDAERKQILDMRERKLEKEKKRLQGLYSAIN